MIGIFHFPPMTDMASLTGHLGLSNFDSMVTYYIPSLYFLSTCFHPNTRYHCSYVLHIY